VRAESNWKFKNCSCSIHGHVNLLGFGPGLVVPSPQSRHDREVGRLSDAGVRKDLRILLLQVCPLSSMAGTAFNRKKER